jgi:GNAT superfamily N-acetyltransferase
MRPTKASEGTMTRRPAVPADIDFLRELHHAAYRDVVPARQGRGLGSSILRDLQEQARAVGVPVRLSVLEANRARALYERHGFVVVGETDTVYRLQWRP